MKQMLQVTQNYTEPQAGLGCSVCTALLSQALEGNLETFEEGTPSVSLIPPFSVGPRVGALLVWI